MRAGEDVQHLDGCAEKVLRADDFAGFWPTVGFPRRPGRPSCLVAAAGAGLGAALAADSAPPSRARGHITSPSLVTNMPRITSSSRSTSTLIGAAHGRRRAGGRGWCRRAGSTAAAMRLVQVLVADHPRRRAGLTCRSPGSVSSQLPPLLGREVDDHGAGLHRLDHARRSTAAGRRLAGDERGGDDDVDVLRLLPEEGHLGLDELLAHHLGVAAGAGAFLLEIDARGTRRPCSRPARFTSGRGYRRRARWRPCRAPPRWRRGPRRRRRSPSPWPAAPCPPP